MSTFILSTWLATPAPNSALPLHTDANTRWKLFTQPDWLIMLKTEHLLSVLLPPVTMPSGSKFSVYTKRKNESRADSSSASQYASIEPMWWVSAWSWLRRYNQRRARLTSSSPWKSVWAALNTLHCTSENHWIQWVKTSMASTRRKSGLRGGRTIDGLH